MMGVNWRLWLVLGAGAGVIFLVTQLQSLHAEVKEQTDKATQAMSLAASRLETINDLQMRQQDVAALDAKYTKELADAHVENDRLRTKLDAGGRVRVAGECKTAATGSLGNAGTVELSPGAGSNVLNIRSGIISDQTKVRYLQHYIIEQCLR